MSRRLMIRIKNMEPFTQVFYVFQQPAEYTGGNQVFSNSLFSQSLGDYRETGARLTFQVDSQDYAAIQQADVQPAIGRPSGYALASRAIDLASAKTASNNWTTASISPLGLSEPVSGDGVIPGAFRITTPVFSRPAIYNVGAAVKVDGETVLSSFMVGNPRSNTDCRPFLKYYVATGRYAPGTVINFTQSSVCAAVCDFTGGHSIIDVTLNENGTWETQYVQ